MDTVEFINLTHNFWRLITMEPSIPSRRSSPGIATNGTLLSASAMYVYTRGVTAVGPAHHAGAALGPFFAEVGTGADWPIGRLADWRGLSV